MKYSRQRQLILDTVQSAPVHPTADAVYNAVRVIEPKISLGTVYRNLNQLAEAGILLKIPIPQGSDRFDGRLDTHMHVVCSRCGAVCDIEFPQDQDLNEQVSQQTGYQIDSSVICFTGLCPECQ